MPWPAPRSGAEELTEGAGPTADGWIGAPGASVLLRAPEVQRFPSSGRDKTLSLRDGFADGDERF